MFDFEEKQVVRRIIYSKVTIFLLALVTLFILKGVWTAYRESKITRINKELAQRELEELKERGENISSEIEILKTKEGEEGEIRSKFGVAKSGEKMVLIIDPKDTKQKEDDGKGDGIWSKFLGWFD